MTDFSVKITVRNARILRAMRAAGYTSQADLARAMGKKSCSSVNGFAAFRVSPLLSDGSWSEMAMDLSSMLHVEPEELWPEALRSIRWSRNSREVLLGSDEARQIEAPRTAEVDKVALSKLISILSPGERRVIDARYGFDGQGERTLEEIAKEMGVTRERIRQREAKAMRLMKTLAYKKGMQKGEGI